MSESGYYADLSLNQWLALTPPDALKAHLNLDSQTVDALRRQKAPLVPVQGWRPVSRCR
jgi:oxalate decarboxylase